MQLFLGVDARHQAGEGQKLVLALVIGVVRAFFVRIVDGGRVPGFMRVEAVHPQVELLVAVHAFQVFHGLAHGAGHVAVFLAVPAVLALFQVVADFAQGGFRHLGARALHHGPVRGFLDIILDVQVDEFVLFVKIVVGLVAVGEPHFIEAARIAELGQAIHGAVEDQGGIDGAAPAQVGDGGVFGRQSHPARHGQGEAAGVHGPAAGHRGQALGVGVFKQRALAGQAIHVGGLDPGVAVTAQVVELEAVEHDDDGVFQHGCTP